MELWFVGGQAGLGLQGFSEADVNQVQSPEENLHPQDREQYTGLPAAEEGGKH